MGGGSKTYESEDMIKKRKL